MKFDSAVTTTKYEKVGGFTYLVFTFGMTSGEPIEQRVLIPTVTNVSVDVSSNVVNSEIVRKVAIEATKNDGGKINAIVPAGVILEENTTSLTLQVEQLTEANPDSITVETSKASVAFDISIPEVADNNTGVIVITLKGELEKNLPSVEMWHGADKMTAAARIEDVDAHNEFYYDPSTGDLTIATTSFSNFTVVFPKGVAQVGNTYYKTFAEAVAAAQTGETVTLLANTSGDGIIIDKNITIDLNTFTYTFDGTLVGSAGTQSCGFQILPGNTVKIQNGSLSMSETAKRGHDNNHGNNFVIQNYANLTLTDVNLIGCDHTSYVLSNNSGTVNLFGTTSVTAANEKVAIDVCKYGNYPIPTVKIDTTGTIDGIVEVSGGNLEIQNGNFIGSGENGLVHVISGNAVINGGTFTASLGSAGYSMAVWAEGGSVTITGGTFANAEPTDGTNHTDLIYASKNGKITIVGGEFNAAIPAWTLNCKDADYKAGTATIVVSGGTFTSFDPANNQAEGPNTNFVAEGYVSKANGSVYIVG